MEEVIDKGRESGVGALFKEELMASRNVDGRW